MAIGPADFSDRKKEGFEYYFNSAAPWSNYESKMILYLRDRGRHWRKEKNEATNGYRLDANNVKEYLLDNPDRIDAVKTLLGL